MRSLRMASSLTSRNMVFPLILRGDLIICPVGVMSRKVEVEMFWLTPIGQWQFYAGGAGARCRVGKERRPSATKVPGIGGVRSGRSCRLCSRRLRDGRARVWRAQRIAEACGRDDLGRM